MDKSAEIALIIPTENELDIFQHIFTDFGFTKITRFPDAEVGFQEALRKQFNIFVIQNENPKMPGIVFLQKLKTCGNYGLEVDFFIGDHIDEKVMNVLVEFDVDYVLAKPYTHERILQKVEYLYDSETSLSDFEKHYRDAKSAFHVNLLDMARVYAIEILKNYGPSEKLCILLGDIDAKAGNIEEARSCYNTALKRNKSSAAAAHKLAKTYMLEKKFDKASEMLNSLTELNPYNLELMLNAGLSNYEVGNHEAAKQNMQAVRKLDKTNMVAAQTIAKVQLQQGDYASLSRTLEETHSAKETASFLNKEGIQLSHAGKYSAALDMYKNCLHLVEGTEYNYVILYNMGICYARANHPLEATKLLEMVLQIKPDHEKTKVALAGLRMGRAPAHS